MPRPPMVLTGPQAAAIGAVAFIGWTYRTTIRTGLHFLRFGPNLLGFFDDEDFDDFIAEQRERLDALADSTDPKHDTTTKE